MISFQHVSKSFDGGRRFAVEDVSFDVRDGETLVLLGSSGSGKTTLLKLTNRLLDSTSGNIEVDGEDREYRRRFDAEWLRPFGFNNTYAITVRKPDAATGNLETISDLIPISGTLRAGFTAEFSERPDGYPGLRRAYGLQFGEVRDFEPALMYEAIANQEVDVICAFATNGRIAAYDLQPLQDDRGFFPPYQAAPVIRIEVLEAHPELREVLELLAGLLDDPTVQRLNYAADEEKRRPADVAREFLESSGLLGE